MYKKDGFKKIYIRLRYLKGVISRNIKINKNVNIIEFTKKPRIYIFLAADYGNLGDVAITYAQKMFLQDIFGEEYDIIEIPYSDTYSQVKKIKKIIKKTDIITIVGGGNLTNRYDGIEEKRRVVIKSFKCNKIISFPQSIEFSDDVEGKEALRRTQKIYNSHPNLILFARESLSYETMKKLFTKNKVYLAPDIVFYLKNKINIDSEALKNTVGICLRNDSEKIIDNSLKDEILKKLQGDRVEKIDTYIGNENLIYNQRYEILKNFIKKYEKMKLVITDRLHCMIFCYLTNTPCIAFDNANHKVKYTYETWLKDIKFIKIIDKKNNDFNFDEFMKNETNTYQNLEDKFTIIEKAIQNNDVE